MRQEPLTLLQIPAISKLTPHSSYPTSHRIVAFLLSVQYSNVVEVVHRCKPPSCFGRRQEETDDHQQHCTCTFSSILLPAKSTAIVRNQTRHASIDNQMHIIGLHRRIGRSIMSISCGKEERGRQQQQYTTLQRPSWPKMRRQGRMKQKSTKVLLREESTL